MKNIISTLTLIVTALLLTACGGVEPGSFQVEQFGNSTRTSHIDVVYIGEEPLVVEDAIANRGGCKVTKTSGWRQNLILPRTMEYGDKIRLYVHGKGSPCDVMEFDLVTEDGTITYSW